MDAKVDDAVVQAVGDLFARVFGAGSDAERQAILGDLDGEMAALGLTDAPMSGASLSAGLSSACSSVGMPAPVQASLGVSNVQVGGVAAVGPLAAAPVVPVAAVLPPPPAAPSYPEVREYITNVSNTYTQVQDNDTVVHQDITQTFQDNSIDIDAVGIGGGGFDEYGNPVPVIDIDIDQDNVAQTNSGDNSAQIGGDAQNTNTGDQGVVNDADDTNVIIPVFGGGSGPLVRDIGTEPNGGFGFPPDDDENTVIVTGNGSSGVGGDNYGNVESGDGDLTDIDAFNSPVAVDGSQASLDQSTDVTFDVDVTEPAYEDPGYATYEAEVPSVPEYEPEYEPAVSMPVEAIAAEAAPADPVIDMD